MIYLQFIEIALYPFAAKLLITKRNYAAVVSKNNAVEGSFGFQTVAGKPTVGFFFVNFTARKSGNIGNCKISLYAATLVTTVFIGNECDGFSREIERIEESFAVSDNLGKLLSICS